MDSSKAGEQVSVGGLLRSRFDVNAVPSRDRYDLWRDSLSCIFDVSPGPMGRPGTDFQGFVEAFRLDNIVLAHTRTREQSWRRSALEIARDGMDHYMLQLFLAGGMSWQRHKGGGEIEPGDMVLFDLSQPMHSETSAFSHLSFILPRGLLEPLLKASDDHHMRRLTAKDPAAAALRQALLRFHALAKGNDIEGCRKALPNLLNLLAVSLEGGDGAHLNTVAWRRWQMERQIHTYIDQHLADQTLGPDAICDALNLSRSALYRHFGEDGGVMHCIRERRLSFAVRLLLKEADCPVGEIARRTGFGSASDFSRVFRRHFGVAPRQVRQRWTIEYPERWRLAVHRYALDREYEAWLHHLAG